MRQIEKGRVHEVGGHAAENQNKYMCFKQLFPMEKPCFEECKLNLFSSKKGGIIREGGIFERGGLLEDLRYKLRQIHEGLHWL